MVLPLVARWALIGVLGQSTWYVNVQASGPGTGAPDDPYPSIQAAVDGPQVTSGDTLLIAPGTYHEAVRLDGKRLTLKSLAGAELTVINADQLGTAITQKPGFGLVLVEGGAKETVIEGLTLSKGCGTSTPSGSVGGGVYCLDETITLRDCIIELNVVGALGGGVYAEESIVTIDRCAIRGNSVTGLGEDAGGGVSVLDSTLVVRDTAFCGNGSPGDSMATLTGAAVWARTSEVLVETCTFTGNWADIGGAIALVDSDARIAASTIGPSNVALFTGGGLQSSGGTLEITDSVFFANSAFQGGGAAAVFSPGSARRSAFLSNCSLDGVGGAAFVGESFLFLDSSFQANEAVAGAGAYAAALSNATFRRCTFDGNEAVADAGGLFGFADTLVERSLFLDNAALGVFGGGAGGGVGGAVGVLNCTLTQNFAGASGGGAGSAALTNSIAFDNQPNDLGNSASARYSLVGGGWPGTGNRRGDPLFRDASSKDFCLMAGSPCIDAGDPASPPDYDGSFVDMGAFRFVDWLRHRMLRSR